MHFKSLHFHSFIKACEAYKLFEALYSNFLNMTLYSAVFLIHACGLANEFDNTVFYSSK